MTSTPARTTDAAALALDGIDHLLVRAAHDIHHAAVHRVLGTSQAIPVRVPAFVHDAVSTAIYGTVSRILRLSSTSVRALSARGVGRDLDETAVSRSAVAALNGLVGSELADLGDRQAIGMAMRHGGQDVACQHDELEQVYPDPSGHLVVFVHGLCGSDESWSLHAQAPYLQQVRARTAGTPVVIRYNTGLDVGDNGAELDHLLSRLCDAWPATVSRVSIIGHGMGALVARAASNRASARHAVWTGVLTDVVSLGAPIAGAGWERAAHLGAGMLRQLLEPPAPEADLALSLGHIGPHEWSGRDVTRRWGTSREAAAPLPHVDYRFVLPAESIGAGEPVDDVRLLSHPQVAGLLPHWLNARERRPAALSARRSGSRAGALLRK